MEIPPPPSGAVSDFDSNKADEAVQAELKAIAADVSYLLNTGNSADISGTTDIKLNVQGRIQIFADGEVKLVCARCFEGYLFGKPFVDSFHLSNHRRGCRRTISFWLQRLSFGSLKRYMNIDRGVDLSVSSQSKMTTSCTALKLDEREDLKTYAALFFNLAKACTEQLATILSGFLVRNHTGYQMI